MLLCPSVLMQVLDEYLDVPNNAIFFKPKELRYGMNDSMDQFLSQIRSAVDAYIIYFAAV